MKQLNHVRQAKGEIVRDLQQKLFCRKVSLLQRQSQVLRLISGSGVSQPGQHTAGLALCQFPNALIHRPTRAAGFDGRSVAIESDVANLSLAGPGPMINLSLDYQAAPYPAPESHVE